MYLGVEEAFEETGEALGEGLVVGVVYKIEVASQHAQVAHVDPARVHAMEDVDQKVVQAPSDITHVRFRPNQRYYVWELGPDGVAYDTLRPPWTRSSSPISMPNR